MNLDENITAHEYESTMADKETVPSPAGCGRDEISVADDTVIMTEAEILEEYYSASLIPAQSENKKVHVNSPGLARV